MSAHMISCRVQLTSDAKGEVEATNYGLLIELRGIPTKERATEMAYHLNIILKKYLTEVQGVVGVVDDPPEGRRMQ